jgi:hypothetical protein
MTGDGNEGTYQNEKTFGGLLKLSGFIEYFARHTPHSTDSACCTATGLRSTVSRFYDKGSGTDCLLHYFMSRASDTMAKYQVYTTFPEKLLLLAKN